MTYPWNRGGPCTTADIFCVRCGSIVGVKCVRPKNSFLVISAFCVLVPSETFSSSVACLIQLATDPQENAVGKFLLEK